MVTLGQQRRNGPRLGPWGGPRGGERNGSSEKLPGAVRRGDRASTTRTSPAVTGLTPEYLEGSSAMMGVSGRGLTASRDVGGAANLLGGLRRWVKPVNAVGYVFGLLARRDALRRSGLTGSASGSLGGKALSASTMPSGPILN